MAIEFQFCRDWVTPSKAGIQGAKVRAPALDPRFRGCNPIPAKIEIRWSSLGVVPLLLYNSISGGRGIAMSQGVRVIGPDRAQLRWEMVDLDSQLPDDHRARLVWAFVEGLDLSEFYDRIKARDAVAGRPATDPQVVLAVWLYATLEGIGSARAIDRLCQQHAAYRWAVRRGADQSRSAGGVSARQCGVVGSPAAPERDRADRRE